MIGRRRSLHPPRVARRGFSLIEVIVAIALLVGVVLAMALGATTTSHAVADSSLRTRANALADQQIALARAWTNYGTLEELASSSYNVAEDGLTPATSVVRDSANGVRLTTITVTVTGDAALGTPVVRRISLAAP